jgi:hypothetical protein
MDISKPQLVAVMLLIAAVSSAAVAQENAVGGQVRLRGSDKPLGQVTVKVPQVPDVNYTTDDKDGVYVLRIPKSVKKFDLIYERDSCFKAADEGILNEQAQNKRPVRELRSTSPTAVRTLPPGELNEIIDRSLEMRIHAIQNNTPALFEAGQSNLSTLAATALTIGNEGQTEAEKGQIDKAEESYKISLAILEMVKPTSYQFAGMLDQYASLLRKTGRSALADQQAARADAVRLQVRSYQTANPFTYETYESGVAYKAWLNPRNWSQSWSRSDKFALENVDSLPNLVGTITVLSGITGQIGRASVPGRGSASFRLYLEEPRAPVLRLLTAAATPFEVEVTGDKGPVQLRRVDNIVTWDPGDSKTFTITISNKEPQTRDYVVSLSAWFGRVTN